MEEEDDKCIGWLPDYFVLIKREIDYVEGYVYDNSQLKKLLQLHSQHTNSHFVKM